MSNVNQLSELRPVDERYTAFAQGLHWLSAALMFTVVPIAWYLLSLEKTDPTRGSWQNLHKSIGITILALTLLRLVWRHFAPPPAMVGHQNQLEKILAEGAHVLLYVALLAMPISGYVGSVAGNHPVPFFGLFLLPVAVPVNPTLAHAAHEVHEVGQWALYLLLALHVAAALFHQLIRKDTVLRRMLPRWLLG